MTRIHKNHPYWHVRELVLNEPAIQNLFLSFYRYRPQSLIDERLTFPIHRDDFVTPNHICQIFEACPPEREVAIHSELVCSDLIKRHIPMADLSIDSLESMNSVESQIWDTTFHEFTWFSSGRSFHGYGSTIINHTEWIQQLGRLLLANPRERAAIVDPRWIGHRMISGFSALRWTQNTKQYLSLPQKISFQRSRV